MNRVILAKKMKITPLSSVHVYVVTVPGKRRQPLEGSSNKPNNFSNLIDAP